MQIIVTENYDEMSERCAQIVKNVLQANPSAVLGLPTGSTPLGVYKLLVKAQKNGEISFKNVTTVNLDEYVGLGKRHKQSYRYFMNKNLFNRVDVDKRNTFVPRGKARDVLKECARYNKIIDEHPVDLQLLGLGQNGHVGFNEPGTKHDSRTHVVALTKSTVRANSRFFGKNESVPECAITMGLGDIVRAKQIVVIASGKQKAKAVKAMVGGKICGRIPSSVLQKHPNVTVIVDRDAACLLGTRN